MRTITVRIPETPQTPQATEIQCLQELFNEMVDAGKRVDTDYSEIEHIYEHAVSHGYTFTVVTSDETEWKVVEGYRHAKINMTVNLYLGGLLVATWLEEYAGAYDQNGNNKNWFTFRNEIYEPDGVYAILYACNVDYDEPDVPESIRISQVVSA
jgi:hypothetical protein